MSLLGNLAPNIQDVSLRGDTSFTLAVVNPDGTPFVLDPTYTYAFNIYRNADDAAALVGPLAVGSGLTLINPTSAGRMKVALSPVQAALLSAQQLYDFMLQVTSLGSTLLAQMGKLLPTLDPKSASYSTAGGTGGLSIVAINTLTLLGEAGGVGYLDGIATTNQGVGCVVQYLDSVGGNPQQWILETSTAATNAGILRRPLDYSVSNTKVWRRIM